jgi:hypothetical protein
MSFVSVIVSATRSWIGMFFSIFILFCFFIEGLNSKIIFSSLVILIFVLIAIKVLPLFHSTINVGLSRFETVKYLAKGDITAGGTLQRFDVRLPIVLKGFYQNPIIGWGFSDTYFKYSDGHVGNFNLLLQVGIAGFFLWLYFWFFFFKTTNSFIKRSSFENKNALKVLNLGVIGMLILHFTTYQFFAYDGLTWGIYFICLYFSLANNILVYNKCS